MNRLKNKYNYLSYKDLKELEKIAQYKKHKKRDIVIKPNTLYKDFSYALKGIARGYFINEEGIEKNVFLVNDDMFFSSPEYLLNYQSTKYTFEAVTDFEYITFNLKALEKLARENQNIAKFYYSALKSIMYFFIQRLEELTTSPPEERFINLHQSRPLLVKKALTKQVANFLGISPNSLSRIKNRLSNKN